MKYFLCVSLDNIHAVCALKKGTRFGRCGKLREIDHCFKNSWDNPESLKSPGKLYFYYSFLGREIIDCLLLLWIILTPRIRRKNASGEIFELFPFLSLRMIPHSCINVVCNKQILSLITVMYACKDVFWYIGPNSVNCCWHDRPF